MHLPLASLFRVSSKLSGVARVDAMRLESVGSLLCCTDSSSLGALVQFSLVRKTVFNNIVKCKQLYQG